MARALLLAEPGAFAEATAERVVEERAAPRGAPRFCSTADPAAAAAAAGMPVTVLAASPHVAFTLAAAFADDADDREPVGTDDERLLP